jgi:transposase InsO family protein
LTDNALEFTMRFSAHPERQSAFERTIAELDLLHGRSQRGCPWQNGFIERSHRTDNEELFHCERFTDPEERRYRLRLWEQEYNTRRPHQGLGGKTPMDVFVSDYLTHVVSRMLM